MSKRKGIFSIFLIGLLSAGVLAVEIQTINDDFKLSIGSNGFFYFGRVGNGTGSSGSLEQNVWTSSVLANIYVEAIYKEHLKFLVGMNQEIKFSYPIEQGFSQSKVVSSLSGIDQMYAQYSTDQDANAAFEGCIGYFNYKYNPDVRNLGEFLFRSGTYPAYIITYPDFSEAKLLGFRVGLNFLERSITNDIMLTTETVFYPSMDWTLSYLIGVNPMNKGLIDIGAGVSFAHLFSVYPDNSSKYGGLTNPRYLSTDGNAAITKDGDTVYYTFKGTKLMGRVSLNPKVLFDPENTIFGKEDLKIYGELCVIGLESYPDSAIYQTGTNRYNPSYFDWKEKAPITFGINIPTFSITDVLSLEFEYFESKYFNDYRHIYVVNGLPTAPDSPDQIKESKWKWSLYTKKSFFDDHCAITVQFARDHMRMFSALYDRANHREMLPQAGNWWWFTKFSYSF